MCGVGINGAGVSAGRGWGGGGKTGGGVCGGGGSAGLRVLCATLCVLLQVEQALALLEVLPTQGLSPSLYSVLMVMQAANHKRRGKHKVGRL